MRTPHDILQTLGELAPDDRDWIVNRLSAQARKNLLDGNLQNDNEVNATPPKSRPEDDALTRMAAVAPSDLAAVLASEPAWVADCVLAMDLPSKDLLKSQLNAAIRMNLATLRAANIIYPEAIQACIRDAVVKALDGVAASPPTQSNRRWPGIEQPGRLAALVRNFGGRFSSKYGRTAQ